MAGKSGSGNPVPVSDLATQILDPVLRKRAGISIGLVQSWEEIAGPRLAAHSRPEKIQWPRRMHEDDPFEPATLVDRLRGLGRAAPAARDRRDHRPGQCLPRLRRGRPHQDRAEAGDAGVEPAKADGRAPCRRDEKARLAGTVGEIEDEGLRAVARAAGRDRFSARASADNR